MCNRNKDISARDIKSWKHQGWCDLKKGIKRAGRSLSQDMEINYFEEELEDLFDIAHRDALIMMSMFIDENKEFLKAQREGGRWGCMLQRVLKMAAKCARKQRRLAMIENRVRKETEQKQIRFHSKAFYENDNLDLLDRLQWEDYDPEGRATHLEE